MTSIQRTSDGFILDAGLLADAFSLTEDEIKKLMREGVITSRCENGIDEDAGRWRLTFYYGDRLCRYIVGLGAHLYWCVGLCRMGAPHVHGRNVIDPAKLFHAGVDDYRGSHRGQGIQLDRNHVGRIYRV